MQQPSEFRKISLHPHKGFTLVEILIGAGVLSIFMAGLFALFSGGNRISSQTLWVQNSVNQLKLAARQISDAIKKGTYPSSIVFPQGLIEQATEDFFINYYSDQLFATQTVPLASTQTPATPFLAITESVPAKTGFGVGINNPASITYHIFSLSDDGRLHYHAFNETVSGDNISTLSRSSKPPAGANLTGYTNLVRDVESVSCVPQNPSDNMSPLRVTITTRYPRGNTTRTETAVGTPNVRLRPRDTLGGW